MKHNWLNDICHFLFGHQMIFGKWIEIVSFDGCSNHGRCKYCGFLGMVDSQGNLF